MITYDTDWWNAPYKTESEERIRNDLPRTIKSSVYPFL